MKKTLHVNKYEVVLVLQGLHVKSIDTFEKHLKKEGFSKIENEEFAYIGYATLSLMHTRAFIFDTLKNAMKLTGIKNLSFIAQMGENPLETYKYCEKDSNFQEIRE